MSWLFGMNKKQEPPVFPQPPSDGAPGGGGGGGGGGQPGEHTPRPAASSAMEAYRFDSSALERAAQAAKDLEKSGEYAAVRPAGQIRLLWAPANPACWKQLMCP